ncbi:MAG: adenosine deaminase [Dehalococcoidia bacterium]
MSDHAVPADLAELPKAELHCHLEGAVRPATREEFAARAGVSIPTSFDNLNSFIDMYTLAWQTMTSPGDYARIVREYCEDAVRCGVRYAELQLATAFRPYDCLGEAVEAASRQRDIAVRFIIDAPRGLPIEISWRMLEAAKGVPEVVAMGLAGQEDTFPPEAFAEIFAEARRRGLRSAPHAGEDAGPASIRGALDALWADRIMHGVRAVDDPALLAELAERRVPLAACPTSNLLTGVARSVEEHPLRALWEAGACVSVNTDDPGFFGCDLTGEYALAGRMLGLDREGYGRLARNSVEGAFAPEELKAALYAEIGDWVGRGA